MAMKGIAYYLTQDFVNAVRRPNQNSDIRKVNSQFIRHNAKLGLNWSNSLNDGHGAYYSCYLDAGEGSTTDHTRGMPKPGSGYQPFDSAYTAFIKQAGEFYTNVGGLDTDHVQWA
jgi:hypothetical protein